MLAERVNRENQTEIQLTVPSTGKGLVTVWEYDIVNGKFIAANYCRGHLNQFKDIPDFACSFVKSGLIFPEHCAKFERFLNAVKYRMQTAHCELLLLCDDGEYRWFSIVGMRIDDSGGAAERYFGQVTTIENESCAKVTAIADNEHDKLTGLYNRHAMAKRVKEYLDENGGDDTALFVLCIDSFKHLKDGVGNLFADALVIETAVVLKKLFPESCFLGRVADEEMVVFVPRVSECGPIKAKCARVCSCVSHIFINGDGTDGITCSVGVANGGAGLSYVDMFYCADVALCSAMMCGGSTYREYCAGMENELEGRKPHTDDITAYGDDFQEERSRLLSEGSLLVQIVEILTQSRELSGVVNMVLALIGRQLGLSRCGVVLFSDDYMEAFPHYSWREDDGEPQSRSNSTIPMEKAERMIFCDGRSRYFVCNDTREMIAMRPDIREEMERIGAKAVLQCPVMDGDAMCGCMTFSFCNDGERFYSTDIDELVIISRVISSYLVRLKSVERYERKSSVDGLTGLHNFSGFIKNASYMVSKHKDKHFAIIYGNLNHFNYINETYGYSTGDFLLKNVAAIVNDSIEQDEIAARGYADRFICLMKYENGKKLFDRLQKINTRINSLNKGDGGFYSLPMRVGVYVLRHGDTDISACLDRAIVAMKSLECSHVSMIAVFESSMNETYRHSLFVESSMRGALRNGEFYVVYQPKVALGSREVVGAEALIRWKSPKNGMLYPSQFVPIFEKNGFITEIDFFVLETVCRKLHDDIRSGRKVIPISVNFSQVHLSTPNFVGRIRNCIRRYDVPPQYVEIEITESALSDGAGFICNIVNALHESGVRVSMDDFGSGYSSLNQLRQLEVDVLKLDKGFFGDINSSSRERCIISNVISMARELNICVVSEGVETNEQVAFLEEIDCDIVQGFYFSGPIDNDDFVRLYQSSTFAEQNKVSSDVG